jgi:hypothetical protein
MKALSVFAAVLIVSAPLFSQTQPASVPAACGDLKVSMAIKLDDAEHTIAQPAPGKALIYFIQDTGLLGHINLPMIKIGIDGDWVGANKGDSYFSVPVAPGQHHLCAAVQGGVIFGYPRMTFKPVTLARFTSEAGMVYFYRTKLTFSDAQLEYLDLEPIDIDEAKYLISSYPLATAHARK